MKHKLSTILLILALTLSLNPAMNVGSEGEMISYIIVGNGNNLPNNLASQVRSAGGTLDVVYHPLGLAVASSSNTAFADQITGVSFVVQDIGFQMDDPQMVEGINIDAANPPSSGDDDFLFDLQWGHDAVNAPEAWNNGITGEGVRVAVLDTGFDLTHPDILPNINFALSADFTGEGLQFNLPTVFSHGTHTAGTIAAADNGFGTIGVAPDAELVLVKVLSDTGSGSFASVIGGIYHAANVDADIISMSLGAVIPQAIPGEANLIAELRIAVARATLYAYQQGSTLIVSAGNAASDLDGGDRSAIRFMGGLPGTFGISALAPLNWANDPNTNLDRFAFYSNYGTSGVKFSAPGGTWEYSFTDPDTLCTVASITVPCWVFDMVYSTGNGGWYWSAGTSMAAPHAAGVAALIISMNGGSMTPAQVIHALQSTADDLGQPGVDDYFGYGRVSSGF